MCPTLGTISFIFLYSISSYNNNTIANNIMKRASPLKKKKVETQIGQIGANQENWAASIARAGAREPPWGSGSPRLRRRRRRNKRRSPQPSTARSAREGRRSESSCEFFCPPPFPPLPSPPADDRSPRFGPSVKSWDCPPSTWLTLPTRRNGVLLLLNSKTCVCSLSLSLSLSLAGSISLRSPP